MCRKPRERTHPFEPRTKIPLSDISKLKSAMAVTNPLELNIDNLGVLFKFLMDMAILSSMECVWRCLCVLRSSRISNLHLAMLGVLRKVCGRVGLQGRVTEKCRSVVKASIKHAYTQKRKDSR